MLEHGQVDLEIKQILQHLKHSHAGDGQVQLTCAVPHQPITHALHAQVDMHLIHQLFHYVKLELLDVSHIQLQQQPVLLV